MGNRRIEPFNAYRYFGQLAKENKLIKEHSFKFCRVTGPKNLEEVITTMRSNSAFFGFDDSDENINFESNGGFFNRRVFTCFLFKKSRLNNMDDYEENKFLCRLIFRQICSRLMKDAESLLIKHNIQVNFDRITFKEIDRTVLFGATGFYFMINVDEPENICFRNDEWDR